MAKCSKCGAELMEGAMFCTECGAMVEVLDHETVRSNPFEDFNNNVPEPEVASELVFGDTDFEAPTLGEDNVWEEAQTTSEPQPAAWEQAPQDAPQQQAAWNQAPQGAQQQTGWNQVPPQGAPYGAQQQAGWNQMPEQGSQPRGGFYGDTNPGQVGQKSKIAAGILAILLGGLGIHKFYLGYTSTGVIMLLVSLFGSIAFGLGPLVMGIIALVEGIIYLTKSDYDFYETYEANEKKWF